MPSNTDTRKRSTQGDRRPDSDECNSDDERSREHHESDDPRLFLKHKVGTSETRALPGDLQIKSFHSGKAQMKSFHFEANS
jgi:hypothetical protein